MQLSSERLGGRTYLYAVVIGFLFFFIGLFVFVRVPQERSARIFFLLCVLFLVFFVCRLRPASYWWIDVFVQNTGTVSLFLLPAVFLHFFLVFPRAKRLHFAKPDEWTGDPPAAWKVWLQEFLSASPGLLYLLYAIPPFVFLYDVFRQVQGEKVTVLSGAPLSSWVLLGDYLVLGLVALAHSAFTLEESRERRQAFHVFVGTICGTVPFVLFFIVLPSAFGIDEYAFYGIIPMILIPLTFAYAIVRFQMLNVRVIVRRTFLYAATTAVLLGLYALMVALANLVFASSRLSASPLFNFGFFLVGISLFEVLRRKLQAPLDKLFFREKFDYQSALLEMSEAITGELDLGRIADYLTASVAATMRLEKASIWLRDREGWLERRGRRDDRLSPTAALRRVLRQEGKPSDIGEISAPLRRRRERGVPQAPARGGLPPARAARLPRAPHGHPRPQGEALGRALRPRRPVAARDAGQPGGAGDRDGAAPRRDDAPGGVEARHRDRARHPDEPAAAQRARDRRASRSSAAASRRGWSAATSTTSSRSTTGGWGSSSATCPASRCRPRC